MATTFRHEYPKLNHVYAEKPTPPPTLAVFLRFYCKFVFFYKPMNLLQETDTWLKLLLQRMEDSEVKERGISVDQLTTVLTQFEQEWNSDHAVDHKQVLDNRADEDFSDPAGRELPTPEFEKLITGLVREVIRYNPGELIKFSQRYFSALDSGKLVRYLQKLADANAKKLPKRQCNEDDMILAQEFLAEDQGVDAESLDHASTIQLIQRTLKKDRDEKRAQADADRKEAEEQSSQLKAEEEAKAKSLEQELREKKIDVNVADELKRMSEKPNAEEEELDVFAKSELRRVNTAKRVAAINSGAAAAGAGDASSSSSAAAAAAAAEPAVSADAFGGGDSSSAFTVPPAPSAASPRRSSLDIGAAASAEPAASPSAASAGPSSPRRSSVDAGAAAAGEGEGMSAEDAAEAKRKRKEEVARRRAEKAKQLEEQGDS